MSSNAAFYPGRGDINVTAGGFLRGLRLRVARLVCPGGYHVQRDGGRRGRYWQGSPGPKPMYRDLKESERYVSPLVFTATYCAPLEPVELGRIEKVPEVFPVASASVPGQIEGLPAFGSLVP